MFVEVDLGGGGARARAWVGGNEGKVVVGGWACCFAGHLDLLNSPDLC